MAYSINTSIDIKPETYKNFATWEATYFTYQRFIDILIKIKEAFAS